MGRGLVVAVLALAGLLCAAGVGFAAYVVSRGSVAVPVTRLQPKPQQKLAPAQLHAKPRGKTAETTVRTRTATTVTTTDDHGGRSRGGSGSGSGSSGHGGGGGGHGSDD